MAMTKEEFLEGIKKALEPEADKEVERMRAEFEELVRELSLHDPILAAKVKKLVTNALAGIEDIHSYIKFKAENDGVA